MTADAATTTISVVDETGEKKPLVEVGTEVLRAASTVSAAGTSGPLSTVDPRKATSPPWLKDVLKWVNDEDGNPLPEEKPKPPAGESEDEKARRMAETTYTRPNGETYFARRIKTGRKKVADELYDVIAVRRAREHNIPVLLYGPPGTGKTGLVEAAFNNVITINGSGDTEVSDFVGSYVQNPDGSFSWLDGPLIRAMEEGRPLFVDEIALVDPRVIAVLYSTMDGRDELVVTANPSRGIIRATEGYYVLGACNPNVPGAVMSEALMSRFTLQVEVLTDFELAKDLKIPAPIITVAKNLTKKFEADELLKAPQMRELLAFKRINDAYDELTAIANFVSATDPSDRDIVIEAVSNAFGVEAKMLTI
jgi:hypothetical protein